MTKLQGMDQISNWYNFWSNKDIYMVFCANESWNIILLKKQHCGTPKSNKKQQKQHLPKNAYFGEIAKKLIFLVKKVSKPI